MARGKGSCGGTRRRDGSGRGKGQPASKRKKRQGEYYEKIYMYFNYIVYGIKCLCGNCKLYSTRREVR